MVHRLTSQYVVVKHPDGSGDVVYKIAGNGVFVPDKLYSRDDLVFDGVGEQTLADETVDLSVVDPDSELADLLREHWGLRV